MSPTKRVLTVTAAGLFMAGFSVGPAFADDLETTDAVEASESNVELDLGSPVEDVVEEAINTPPPGDVNILPADLDDTDPGDPGDGGDPPDPGDGGDTDPGDPGDGGDTDPGDPGDGGDPPDPGDGGGTDPDPGDPGDGGDTDPGDPGDTDPGGPGDTNPGGPGDTNPGENEGDDGQTPPPPGDTGGEDKGGDNEGDRGQNPGVTTPDTPSSTSNAGDPNLAATGVDLSGFVLGGAVVTGIGALALWAGSRRPGLAE